MSAPLVKCVVWDLDSTIWSGTLAEGDEVAANPTALALVDRLERAGIVQSIASKNDRDDAIEALRSLGIADVFVHPQISWTAKSASVRNIIDLLSIGQDATVFLDDSEFERAEVAHFLTQVRCHPLEEFLELEARDGLIPSDVTPEAAARPSAYRGEALRKAAEAAFEGTSAEFLASLGMELRIRPATPADLERAAELTERTNQLNTTGRSYSVAELSLYADAADREVLIAELDDRFGAYGRIGLCLLRRDAGHWLIELLLTSCRVMGRNVGTALIATVARTAARDALGLRAVYRGNARNRQMRITYGFLGFKAIERQGDTVVYEHPAPAELAAPPYIRVLAG